MVIERRFYGRVFFKIDRLLQDLNKTSISSKLASLSAEQKESNREYLKCIIQTVRLLATQNLAFRGHDETENSLNRGNFVEILTLLSEYREDISSKLIKKTYTSKVIQNEIIDILASQVKKSIIDQLKDTPFSVIIDETQDISCSEQVAVVICFLDKNLKVQENFIGEYAGKESSN